MASIDIACCLIRYVIKYLHDKYVQIKSMISEDNKIDRIIMTFLIYIYIYFKSITLKMIYPL